MLDLRGILLEVGQLVAVSTYKGRLSLGKVEELLVDHTGASAAYVSVDVGGLVEAYPSEDLIVLHRDLF
jgi:hypothetical protein